MKQGIKEKDIRDFEKYAKKLSGVLAQIRAYKPEVNAYLAMNDLNLMSDDFRQMDIDRQQDFIVTTIHMEGFDGGDW